MRTAVPLFWSATRLVSRRLLLAAALLALAVSLLSVTTGDGGLGADAANASAAQKKKRKNGPNPVTPGDFTGYGFDQCHTPNQASMNTWLEHSPFLAVGVYISGDSRACRDQPNLTPAWVSTQLANGWRLLPITLGPQASCQPRFPRYDDDFKIDPTPGAGKYSKARTMVRTTPSRRCSTPRRSAWCPAAPSGTTSRDSTPRTRTAGSRPWPS